MLFQETVGENRLICKVCHLNDAHAQNTADVCSTLTHGEKIHAFSDYTDGGGIKQRQSIFTEILTKVLILILLILSVMKTKNAQL